LPVPLPLTKKERQKKKIKIGRYIAGDIFFFFYLLSENLDELLLSQFSSKEIFSMQATFFSLKSVNITD
jgi:hypothetical protein